MADCWLDCVSFKPGHETSVGSRQGGRGASWNARRIRRGGHQQDPVPVLAIVVGLELRLVPNEAVVVCDVVGASEQSGEQLSDGRAIFFRCSHFYLIKMDS